MSLSFFRNRFIVLITVITFIFIIILLILIRSSKQTINPIDSLPAKGIVQDLPQEELDRGSKIVRFIKKLPYHGKNFTLYYDMSTDIFILDYGKNRALGEQEFIDYLHSNGIPDKTWLKNLQTN
jgi:hypothetical protein